MSSEGRRLVAIRLPPPEAARDVSRCWDAGEAVLPLDPRAPAAEITRVLEVLRPTHLSDGTDDRRPLAGGQPVAPEVAAVVATSGTTATPRGVELTWDGMSATVQATLESVGASAGDTWLCCVPLHHVAGVGILARAWTGGVKAVVAPFDPATLGQAGAAFVSLVPTMLARALRARADLAGFRRVLVGAAHLPSGLHAEAAAAGARLVDAYGLTETWGGAVHDGRALRDVEVALSERGEILFRGPVVMRGYRLMDAETSRVVTADGWLCSGDLGRFEPDGRLRVTGRLREMIVTGGVNVSPVEVEEVLAGCPGVREICVAGRSDPEWGERVVAYVVPADPSDPPTLERLRAFAADRVAAPKLPREMVLVGAIPRTETGKPLRRLLPDLHHRAPG